MADIPSLCPTVLVTALLMFTPLRFPQVSWPHAFVATTFTMLIPWAALVWARKTGKVSDIHITRREQRWPLLLTALADPAGPGADGVASGRTGPLA
ncbi:hypothetical protein Q2T94_05640 [Paeniglutamicibacter sulfureus]|uniref:hypothetical protein n=1 Tax=Paeniglutamicibacter sulfureus TaxID=43666 RepID=UPI00266665E5|nr:hypothetical protein [Paeniglutamicibacter sulfureus]MDO2933786.1 hypothetical protein [Paeniglutamicibacter sulfureus]